MIKRFPLQFTEAEHRALKVAAAQAGESMNQYLRVALAEKLARQSDTPHGENIAPAAPPTAPPPTLPNEVLAKANAEKAA